jgi:hypothetical protein
MPASARSLLPVLALLAALPTGCLVDECEQRYRCLDSARYEWCNVGSDWEVHRRVLECPAPNAACVPYRDTSTLCVHAPATPCGAGFTDSCEGPLRVYCNERLGWVQAVDCTALGSPGCAVDPRLGKAICLPPSTG